jgi:hypothetical protein
LIKFFSCNPFLYTIPVVPVFLLIAGKPKCTPWMLQKMRKKIGSFLDYQLMRTCPNGIILIRLAPKFVVFQTENVIYPENGNALFPKTEVINHLILYEPPVIAYRMLIIRWLCIFDTSDFVCDSIKMWWNTSVQRKFSHATSPISIQKCQRNKNRVIKISQVKHRFNTPVANPVQPKHIAQYISTRLPTLQSNS